MRIRMSLCGLALVAGLAACGGGGGGAASNSNPAASTPSTGTPTGKGIDTPSSVSIVSPTN